MRRSITFVLLGVLSMTAATLQVAGRATANDEQPMIVLRAMEVGMHFKEGPTTRWKVAPTGIHMAFGLLFYPPCCFDPNAVLFDDILNASDQPEVQRDVLVAEDSRAEAIAHAMTGGGPAGRKIGVGAWLEGGNQNASWGPDMQAPLMTGSTVSEFRLKVPRFTIRIVPQSSPDAQPYSMYEVMPVDNVEFATVEVIGTPPHGDANCDAAINSIDALVMLQHGAGLLDTLSCAKAADVNADATVDARDAQLVLQFTAGLISAL